MCIRAIAYFDFAQNLLYVTEVRYEYEYEYDDDVYVYNPRHTTYTYTLCIVRPAEAGDAEDCFAEHHDRGVGA